MKNQLLVFLLVIPFFALAQMNVPPASPKSTIQQQVGLTNFEVIYSRPSVNGRAIFGELVPYGEIWRTGANEATLITFDRYVIIDDVAIGPGTYSMFTFPGEEEWTWVLNTVTDSWGARAYEEENDVAQVKVTPSPLPERIETMEIRWMNLTHTSVDLVMEWENVRVVLPMALPTHEQVEAQIATHLNENASGSDYYKAARYYLDNDLDLERARRWMDKRMELDGEQFGVMRYQALIEHKLGDIKAANATMQRSLELAKERPNPHYVSMNEASLRLWNKQSVDINANDLLAKSLAYHDPENTWETGSFDFKLYESRPSGGYRISDISIDNEQGSFSVAQRRDRDLIERYVKDDNCVTKLNGSEDFSDEDQKRLRLSCDLNKMYNNYYSYLWGLPMKLRDEGTIIAPQVHLVDFFGEELYEIRVTYTEEVGADIWYFYFDQQTFAMHGYRFYHDEADNDGEYILLEGEAEVGPIKVPAIRHWYTHKDRRYLGSDEIID